MRKGVSDMQIPQGTQRKPCILFSPKRSGFMFREKIWCSYFPQFQTFGKKSLSCRAFIEEELVNVRRLPPSSNPSPLHSFLMTINTRFHFPLPFKKLSGEGRRFCGRTRSFIAFGKRTVFSKEVRFHVPPENLILLFSTISKFWQKSLSCRAFIEEELVNVCRLPPSSPPSPLHSFLMTDYQYSLSLSTFLSKKLSGEGRRFCCRTRSSIVFGKRKVGGGCWRKVSSSNPLNPLIP